jgi:hypothetical protein
MRFLSLLIVLFFSAALPAQQNEATVVGKLFSKNGSALKDVTVRLKGNSASVQSDSAGNFTLQIPSDSDVVLLFSHVSIPPQSKKIKAGKRETVRVNFSLDDFTTLETVVIVDEADRNVFIHKLPTKDILVHTGASMDFNLVLFSQPGVFSNNELSSGYSVRGGNFDENLVYVNDIEVYRPFLTRSGQQEGLSFVNPDMVADILFSTGGFEAKYGDKLSSVLDIKYKKPREFAGTVAASMLGGSIHLEGASENKRFTWLTGVRQKSNRYILNSLDTKGDYFPSFTDVQTFLTYDISDEWEIDVLTNVSQNKYNLIPQSRQSDFGTVNAAYRLSVYFGGQEYDAFTTYLGAVSLINRPYGKDLTLKYIASAFRTNESETFDIYGEYSLDELETDFGKDEFGQVKFNIGSGSFLNHARNYLNATVYSAEHKGQKLFTSESKFNWTSEYHWGIKGQTELIEDKLSEWKMVDSAGYSLPQGNPSLIELQDVIKSNNTTESIRFNSFVQGAWGCTTHDSVEYKITAGVRALYWDFNKEFLAGPRVTFSLKPHWKKDILFKASGGYYYRANFYSFCCRKRFKF